MAFADTSMEAVCYYAYWASTELAEERGRYSSFKGSLWDRGVLPQDSLEAAARRARRLRRGRRVVDARLGRRCARASRSTACATRTAWPSRRRRRSPTSSASSASIEPEYQNIYVKSNLSGEFTVVNEQLVRDLKALGLWDDVMVSDLKYFDGSLAKIDRVPAELRELYATAFEVEPKWIVEAGARRQKWIDQAQSLNIYMAGASGKKLDETYKLAWLRGLKTTYYLRTLAATSAEKSTGKGGELNAVPASGGSAASVSAGARGACAAASSAKADQGLCEGRAACRRPTNCKACLIDDRRARRANRTTADGMSSFGDSRSLAAARISKDRREPTLKRSAGTPDEAF